MSGICRPRSSTSVRRLGRLALVAAGVWMALLATAIPATAHPVLLFTDPAQDGAITDWPPVHDFGTRQQVADPPGSGGQEWTVADLKKGADRAPGYPVAGQLWEAAASVDAVDATVTPLIPELSCGYR